MLQELLLFYLSLIFYKLSNQILIIGILAHFKNDNKGADSCS